MVDRLFEARLDRLFAEAPVFPDAEVFAARLEARLERGWNFRQVLIGGLGVVGGLIGGAQILGSGLAGRLGALTAHSGLGSLASLGAAAAPRFLPGGFAIDGEVLWMSGVLAVLAAGFAIARMIREI